MFTFRFQFVQNSDLEGDFSHFSTLLSKLHSGLFVTSKGFVDQMASCGGLAQSYMSNDDYADESSFPISALNWRWFSKHLSEKGQLIFFKLCALCASVSL